jgi:hypothetical protein
MGVDAVGVEVNPGDVVQITNSDHHWYPAFIAVTDLKSFGIMGYNLIVDNSDDINGRAYIRLNSSDYERIGQAKIWAA